MKGRLLLSGAASGLCWMFLKYLKGMIFRHSSSAVSSFTSFVPHRLLKSCTQCFKYSKFFSNGYLGIKLLVKLLNSAEEMGINDAFL